MLTFDPSTAPKIKNRRGLLVLVSACNFEFCANQYWASQNQKVHIFTICEYNKNAEPWYGMDISQSVDIRVITKHKIIHSTVHVVSCPYPTPLALRARARGRRGVRVPSGVWARDYIYMYSAWIRIDHGVHPLDGARYNLRISDNVHVTEFNHVVNIISGYPVGM